MTKTIGIITLYGDINFGNKLQNYASQRYFEHMGYMVWTFPNVNQIFTSKNPMLVIKGVAHKFLQFVGLEKVVVEKKKKEAMRSAYIRTFSDQYIHLFPNPKEIKSPKKIQKRFDFFVAGSDQVWHYSGKSKHLIQYYFLSFAKPEQRITMAPSFSFSVLPEKYEKLYRKGLGGFLHLSVREEAGAKLIKKLIGKDATVLADPTMLIEKEEWLKILKKPSQYVNNNYIFVYALGGFKGEEKEIIDSFANNLNITIVDIMDTNSDYYVHTRPDEFLYWIYHAKLVITDSFHATVFAILFDKPFVVTERSDIKDMGSRLDTLLSKFKLQDRRFEILQDIIVSENANRKILFQKNTECVAEILEAERKKAIEFYDKCFHTTMENFL